MQPDEQIGVAILSNMDTTFTTVIGQGVMDLWEGNNVNLIIPTAIKSWIKS